MEGAFVGRAGQEGLAPEDQRKQPERVAALRRAEGEEAFVVAGEIEDRREIDLEELFGHRPGALVVEPPACAVGENTPTERARREIVDASQIAQHLGRWRRLLAGSPGVAVERTQPALGLHDRKTELVAPPLLGEAVGPALRRIVCKQQTVRHVRHAAGAQVLPS